MFVRLLLRETHEADICKYQHNKYMCIKKCADIIAECEVAVCIFC